MGNRNVVWSFVLWAWKRFISIKKPASTGDAGSGVTGVLVVDALLVEHGEHNTGDCFDNGEFEPKLNLDLFCLEWRVDVGTFFCVLRVVSVGSVWENLWNLLLHFDHYLH